jgi:hypothetical protein
MTKPAQTGAALQIFGKHVKYPTISKKLQSLLGRKLACEHQAKSFIW